MDLAPGVERDLHGGAEIDVTDVRPVAGSGIIARGEPAAVPDHPPWRYPRVNVRSPAVRRILLIVTDAAAWAVSVVGAALLQGELDVVEPAPLLTIAVVAGVTVLAVGGLRQLYAGRHGVGSADDTANVAVTFGLAGLAAFTVGVLDRPTPWSIPVIALPIALTVAVGARLSYRLHRDGRHAAGGGGAARRVVVFGADDSGLQVLASLQSDPNRMYRPVALLDDNPGLVNRRLRGVPVRGTARDAATVALAEGADLLIVAGQRLDAPVTRHIVEAARPVGLEVRVVPPLREVMLARPVHGGTRRRRSGMVRTTSQGRGKRALDVVLCLLALPVLLPLGLVLTLLVALSSSDEVIYRARRLGRNGRVFTMYKFSGMRQAAGGPAVTQSRDPRITRLGRILRASKLDELPQVLNVLKGDMSVVGPRPEDPRYLAHFSDEQLQVLMVRPGMTSAAFLRFGDEPAYIARAVPDDVEGYYLSRVLPEKLDIELDYVRSWSLRRDLAIIGRTFVSLVT